MKWLVYTRGTVPIHRLSLPMFSVHEAGTQLVGLPVYNMFYYNQESKLWWCWDKRQITNIGNYLIKSLSNKKFNQKHFDDFVQYTKRSIKASDSVVTTDFSQLDNDKLFSQYLYLYKESLSAHGLMSPTIDAIDVVFEKFLKDKIFSELPTDVDREDIYKTLTIPLCKTYLLKLEQSLINLSAKKNIKNEDIDKLYKKFWWVPLGWENIKPYDKSFFVNEINKYKKDKDKLYKYKKIDQNLIEAKRQRNKLIKKYKLSKDIVYWLWIMDKYNYFHDLRKEMQVRTIYSAYLLMSAVAKKLSLPKDDLEWLTHNEVMGLLKGARFDQAEVARRKKSICVIYSKDKIKIFSGSQASKIFKKEILIKNSNVKKIKGDGVSKGKVKGIVKVCSGAQEAFKKIKKNNILVCGMTLPDYLPAMKKAKAIITDEGGITCHAAIVSRELGIPCIVGTKIATQALKDGDIVEVDANQGIVKIIK